MQTAFARMYLVSYHVKLFDRIIMSHACNSVLTAYKAGTVFHVNSLPIRDLQLLPWYISIDLQMFRQSISTQSQRLRVEQLQREGAAEVPQRRERAAEAGGRQPRLRHAAQPRQLGRVHQRLAL